MTMAEPSQRSNVSPEVSSDLQATLAAARELRDARGVLRGGNVVHGVRRYEQAKRELYRTIHDLTASAHPHDPTQDFVRAATAFHGAYDAYRTSGADAHAARGLARAEHDLFGELDRLEQALN